MSTSVQVIEIAGQRMTILPESQYMKLLDLAGLPTPELGLPPLPKELPGGGFPALEYARASLARDIVRQRRRLGLTQRELARRAGLPAPSLNRIETGKVDPAVSTVEKIDRALKSAERDAQRAGKA